MKKCGNALILALCLAFLSGCGCAKSEPPAGIEESMPEERTQTPLQTEPENKSSAETPTPSVHEKADPPPLSGGAALYDKEGNYAPPPQIDDQEVILSGHYDGGQAGGAEATEKPGSAKDPDESDAIAQAGDLYQNALSQIDAFSAEVAFHYYADGWHDEYRYQVHGEREQGRYSAVEQSTGRSIAYASGMLEVGGKTTEQPFQEFCRYCSFLEPFPLEHYDYTGTKEETVVSALLNGQDYRNELLRASVLFNGFETYDNEALSVGQLHFTARLDQQGRLAQTRCAYTLEIGELDMIITVVIETNYEKTK